MSFSPFKRLHYTLYYVVSRNNQPSQFSLALYNYPVCSDVDQVAIRVRGVHNVSNLYVISPSFSCNLGAGTLVISIFSPFRIFSKRGDGSTNLGECIKLFAIHILHALLKSPNKEDLKCWKAVRIPLPHISSQETHQPAISCQFLKSLNKIVYLFVFAFRLITVPTSRSWSVPLTSLSMPS